MSLERIKKQTWNKYKDLWRDSPHGKDEQISAEFLEVDLMLKGKMY